ncbi:transposable element Tcb1 transposase [Trichonephila clavipes]|nr:transposable element Tcb1 transposase [Trichonephila clavipes]
MTAQRYVLDILQPHVLPLMQRLPGAIFNKTILGIQLSPIEHMWDDLGCLVRHFTSVNKLIGTLQQIWNEMSQDIIQNLNASMPDRIASCICAKGVSTGGLSTLECFALLEKLFSVINGEGHINAHALADNVNAWNASSSERNNSDIAERFISMIFSVICKSEQGHASGLDNKASGALITQSFMKIWSTEIETKRTLRETRNIFREILSLTLKSIRYVSKALDPAVVPHARLLTMVTGGTKKKEYFSLLTSLHRRLCPLFLLIGLSSDL